MIDSNFFHMKKYFLGFILLFTSLEAFTQCMMVPLSLQDRVQSSTVIVEATAVQQHSFWNTNRDFIYTSTTLNIHSVLKGTLSSQQIQLITEGGNVGTTKIVAEPNLNVKVNEVGIFMLIPSTLPSPVRSNDLFDGCASAQSFIRYNLINQTASDPFTQYPSIANLKAAIENITGVIQLNISPLPFQNQSARILVPPTISGIVPAITTAGTFSTITISGNNFGASYINGTSNVEFPDANNGGAGYISAPANHIVSWNNTQIQVWVPTQGGSGNIRVTNNLGEVTTSGISLTVNYNESNVVSGGIYYQPDLINNNGTAGYTWKYNTTFNGNAAAVAAWERALQTWRCGTFVNFNRAGTTAIACQALDGNNIVTFDGSCALPAGVLGISYSYYSACAAGIWYVTENDLKFRTNGTGGINWNYGPVATAGGLFDFESVCLHELGHSHQLGHTITPVTVMNYAVGPNTDRRTLTGVSEVAGGNDIMSRSIINNSCGPNAMVALTAGSCAINAPIADFTGTPLTGCNSLNVAFTDASLGTPTSWTWSFPGGVPNTFIGQNPPVINYAGPGSYSVTLTVSNAFGSNSQTKTNYVVVNNCPPPVANFTASPTITCPNVPIQFADLSTNTPTSWSWTFTGGTPAASALQNPIVSYATPGLYSVTLTATNAYGSNSITKTNYIGINACPPPPVANFSASPTTICAGGTVNFTDLSTNTPTDWAWTFPGGTPISSISQNPSVVYNTPGTYLVTLTATNSGGSNTKSVGSYITVNVCAAPVAAFSGYPTTICEGQAVTYVDQSTNAPTSWSWTFPGGAPAASAIQNPVISYPVAGTYNVSLTASNGFGGNSLTKNTYINVVTCPSPGSGLIVNDGSFIYVQPGALVHVDGGVINQDNTVNIGTWDNRGTVRIQGDWTNNSSGNAFINSSPGIVELFGANQTIRGTTPTYFYTLNLTGSGIKTQNVDARVEGVLQLNDRELATQGNIMYVTNPSTLAITRTGPLNSTPVQGFVSSTGNGRLWRNTNSTSVYLFPVGSSLPPARFRPVSIRPLAATVSTYAVRMVNNDPTPNGYNVTIREATLGAVNNGWYQKINQISGSAFTEFSLYADDVQDAIASWPLLKMTQWGQAAPPVWWKDIGGAASGAASPVLGSILRTNWSNFSSTENFNIAPQSNPLPVELLSFTANCDNGQAVLKWTTASEINNDYFTIEQSTDGKLFELLARVNGHGTTSQHSDYVYKTGMPASKMFYRLLQHDFDNRTTTFKPIALTCRDNFISNNAVDLFPNPAATVFISNIYLSQNTSLKMEVVNMLGQKVLSKEFNLDNGQHAISTSITDLAADVYQVNFSSPYFTIVKRLVVTH